MLLTFDEDGTVQFTRSPKTLALVEGLGKLAVTRMSEILFEEETQAFYIKFVTGRFAGRKLKWRDGNTGLSRRWWDFRTQHSPALAHDNAVVHSERKFQSYDCVVYFPTYEAAVQIEVAFIDYLREQQIAVQ